VRVGRDGVARSHTGGLFAFHLPLSASPDRFWRLERDAASSASASPRWRLWLGAGGWIDWWYRLNTGATHSAHSIAIIIIHLPRLVVESLSTLVVGEQRGRAKVAGLVADPANVNTCDDD
jgi:hypothetical protein